MTAVVEETDERRQAERPRHQHRFVVVLVGMLAERIDVSGRRLKLLLGQLHFAGEIVKMANEGGHDLAKARIGRPLKLPQHRLGNVLLVADDHRLTPRALACWRCRGF